MNRQLSITHIANTITLEVGHLGRPASQTLPERMTNRVVSTWFNVSPEAFLRAAVELKLARRWADLSYGFGGRTVELRSGRFDVRDGRGNVGSIRG